MNERDPKLISNESAKKHNSDTQQTDTKAGMKTNDSLNTKDVKHENKDVESNADNHHHINFEKTYQGN